MNDIQSVIATFVDGASENEDLRRRLEIVESDLNKSEQENTTLEEELIECRRLLGDAESDRDNHYQELQELIACNELYQISMANTELTLDKYRLKYPNDNVEEDSEPLSDDTEDTERSLDDSSEDIDNDTNSDSSSASSLSSLSNQSSLESILSLESQSSLENILSLDSCSSDSSERLITDILFDGSTRDSMDENASENSSECTIESTSDDDGGSDDDNVYEPSESTANDEYTLCDSMICESDSGTVHLTITADEYDDYIV